MSLTDRYQDWLRKGAWLCLGASLAAGLALFLQSSRLGAFLEKPSSSAPRPVTWPGPRPQDPTDWSGLHVGQGAGVPRDDSPLAARFRLAGTFFAYGETIQDQRKAIVDDIESGTQRIVSEGEDVAGVRVARIFRDRIILREGVTEEQLWLSFSNVGRDGASTNPVGSEADPSHAGAGEGWSDEESEPYGLKRVGEYRWVFDRGRLMEYYRELMNEPQRLLQTFDSMKPLYDENGGITGYQLVIEGEAGFFRAVGMEETDIIRSVNSIPMTNRRRAEFFIHEFVHERANAFVLEVERNQTVRKLTYQMR